MVKKYIKEIRYRLLVAEKDRIVAAARRLGITQSDLVRQAVSEFLRREEVKQAKRQGKNLSH